MKEKKLNYFITENDTGLYYKNRQSKFWSGQVRRFLQLIVYCNKKYLQVGSREVELYLYQTAAHGKRYLSF